MTTHAGRRGEERLPRLSHKQEPAGSTPAPATSSSVRDGVRRQRTIVVQAADLQYLSERQIRRETKRSSAWVSAHTPLMPGCDYTPTGQRRVPRVCVHEFIKAHRPEECPACETQDARAATRASVAR